MYLDEIRLSQLSKAVISLDSGTDNEVVLRHLEKQGWWREEAVKAIAQVYRHRKARIRRRGFIELALGLVALLVGGGIVVAGIQSEEYSYVVWFFPFLLALGFLGAAFMHLRGKEEYRSPYGDPGAG